MRTNTRQRAYRLASRRAAQAMREHHRLEWETLLEQAQADIEAELEARP